MRQLGVQVFALIETWLNVAVFSYLEANFCIISKPKEKPYFAYDSSHVRIPDQKNLSDETYI